MIRPHQLLLFLLFFLTVMSCEKTNKDDGHDGAVCSVGGDSIVTDIDGNAYHVVSIGGQCWLKENLRTTRYRNGDSIATGLGNFEWKRSTSGAWVNYGNASANDSIFGKLYNYFAVVDPRGLCPVGWHVPTGAEWEAMEEHISADTVPAGGRLKARGNLTESTGLWSAPNLNATNSSGFTALPGGMRLGGDTISNSPFFGKNLTGYWWSSSAVDTENAQAYFLGYSTDFLGKFDYRKFNGFSVRCVRD